MKTIGIVGGMGWAASAVYYRILNETVRDRLGGLHSARLILDSLDHAEIADAQQRDDWPFVARSLREAAQRLERAGASFVLIACNTVHRVAGEVESAIRVPFLHIADAAGEVLQAEGRRRVGILGTRRTMEGRFYAERLADGFGIELVRPPDDDRERVDRAIFEELVHDRVSEATAVDLAGVARRLGEAGADAILLACTELSLLVPEGPGEGGEIRASPISQTGLPLYDTSVMHARAAVDRALLGTGRSEPRG